MHDRVQGTYGMGIDIGGTKICLGVIDGNGALLAMEQYPSSSIPDIYGYLKTCMSDFWMRHPEVSFPVGIGIGARGYVNWKEGVWEYTDMFPCFRHLPIKRFLERDYAIPVTLDNDVHAATLAELYFGAGRQHSDFIYINIGTGLAVGIVSEGKLIRGNNNYAGEWGNIMLLCSETGCVTLESIISGRVLSEIGRSLLAEVEHTSQCRPENTEEIRPEYSLFLLYKNGNKQARAILQPLMETLVQAIRNLIVLLNPSVVVFGGGVMRDGFLFEWIQQDLKSKHFAAPSLKSVKLCQAHFGANLAGLYGAATLAMEEFHSPKSGQKIKSFGKNTKRRSGKETL